MSTARSDFSGKQDGAPSADFVHLSMKRHNKVVFTSPFHF